MVDTPPLSLYVHLPWCVRKCPYCDFNSHAAKGELPIDAYIDALLQDLAEQAAWVEGRPVTSVFFGGGTPSLFPPEAVARLLEGARGLLPFDPAAEVTLEANPGTVEHGPFPDYRHAGVNRVSLGVQSFSDDLLRRIGRIHGGAEAGAAVEQAVAAGLRVNVDLMFALPGQDLDGALADVRRALASGAGHLSHYQLTLEPNTLFHARPPKLPDDEAAWNMQRRCQDLIAAAGFEHYEVSAYARPGERCRHNLNYWTFGDYLGIGAGAHGKWTDPASGAITRTLRHRHPRTYLDTPAGAGALQQHRRVPAEEVLFEFALNAWRLQDGVSPDLIEARTGTVPDPKVEPWRTAVEAELLAMTTGCVRPTDRGARFLNDLTALFMEPIDA